LSRQVVLYDELSVGQTFPEFEFAITEDVIEKYCQTIGETNEKFLKAASGEKRVAPPTIVSLFTFAVYKNFIDSPSGTLHAKQSYLFNAPLYAGDVLKVSARITEKYVNAKGRKFVIFESDAKRGDEVVSTSIMTLCWAK